MEQNNNHKLKQWKDIIFITNGTSDSFRSKPTKLEKSRITNIITSTTAPKVNVQEKWGVNTIAKP
jgi:ribonucleotide monophosphatase NagD (HAD superfamily)